MSNKSDEFVPHADWPFPKQHLTAADLEINILRDEIERLTKELFKAKRRYSREWVGLTDEEITNLWSWSMTCEAERTASTQQHAFARAIEAALKEKNA